MKRRILIFTVSAGEGHNSIANTIKNKLLENPDNEVKLVNIFKEYGTKLKQYLVNDGYLNVCKHAMHFYNVYFKKLQRANPEKRYKNWFQKQVHKEMPQMFADIEKFAPDVIISTHMYGGIAVSLTRRKKDFPIPTIQLLTDYTVTPYFESAIGVDYLVTPSSDMNERLIYKGYKANQLVDIGLPVRDTFNEHMDKTEARKQLGLDPSMFTVVLFIGGGGMGRMRKLVKQLNSIETPIQMLILNGRDEKGKKSVERFIAKQKNSKHIFHNYGFIQSVAPLMDAMDVIVGKCGCTVANEVMNKHKAFVITHKLPQQELENMKYLTSNNAAIYVDKQHPLKDIVIDLMNHPEKIKELEENIKKIARPNAAKNICEFIEKVADEKKEK